ncbi:MAG: hypothetical protein HC825_02175 [Oscillatoriales cyanobacterium RM1_1_9]|nr:hypothetical protein [Oscillatoriales cyanobacterium SM2_3_0]NJO45562.1 hypothetical protein [Oscillatoriales cyanobacterium RM2_1_1]NJO70821.1 hypothetical protein [Oscillatoriales cyanobacterium RM1_1_9]
MTPLNARLHQLVDRLQDQDLELAWELLVTFYYDVSMLRAIQAAQAKPQPGDSFTYEETIQTLYSEYGHKL